IERRAILRAYGANVVLTPGHLGMAGAIQTAEELVEKTPGSFMPQQFKNPANPQKHRDTTAEEIWRDTGGVIDAFVAGVGTGGTVSGVGSVLKRYQPRIHIVGVEPADSAVISGQAPGPHMIQGIGAGFIPDNLDRTVLDEVLTVRNDDALGMGRYLARTEGILSGISSGANVHAAVELAKRPEFKGKTIVCIICDTGERYLSTVLFDQ
ncbi:MAG: pyridoxal-phosphate dependent enzyme, partial [bacterium]|nr:pyridoxal-phosphate dependent enzyme [bacterium]